MKKIDARGLACPQPVLELKRALQSNPETVLLISVDNEAAKENVRRFAHSQNCKTEIRTVGSQEYEITVLPAGHTVSVQPVRSGKIVNKTIYITDDKIGQEEVLGKTLLKGFIYALLEADQWPDRIFFVNRGVLVTTKNPEVIEDLKKLAGGGVAIFSCGTCLNYYGVTDELKVGLIGNAYDTINSLITADSVIKL